MDATLRSTLLTGLSDGSIVPCLGPGVLADVTATATGAPMPATGRELILAMNGGKPMAAKLMYEFSRAAMYVEHKRGRSELNAFLTHTYGRTQWTRAAAHEWLATLAPRYVIDLNRDTQLQQSYAGTPHYLVQGCARLTGLGYRFHLFRHDGTQYERIAAEAARADLPVLFKPMGSPLPEPCYVASDADYVDYITELMGGFGVPPFVKQMRREKRYLFMGLRLDRDTERMVMGDLIYGSAREAGWVFLPGATAKERKFLARHGLTLLDEDFHALFAEAALA